MRVECYYRGHVVDVLLVQRPLGSDAKEYVCLRGQIYPIIGSETVDEFLQRVSLGDPLEITGGNPLQDEITKREDIREALKAAGQGELDLDSDTPLAPSFCPKDAGPSCEACQ